MGKSCFDCGVFPNCPILGKMRYGDGDELDNLIVAEYGKHCESYIRY